MVDRIIKKSFGIARQDIEEGKGRKKIIVDTSIEELNKNPINSILSEFQKEHDKIWADSSMIFDKVVEYLNKIDGYLKIEEYHDMDIIKEISMLLEFYKMWAFTFKKFESLASEKMEEVRDVVKKYYIPKSEFDKLDNEFRKVNEEYVQMKRVEQRKIEEKVVLDTQEYQEEKEETLKKIREDKKRNIQLKKEEYYKKRSERLKEFNREKRGVILEQDIKLLKDLLNSDIKKIADIEREWMAKTGLSRQMFYRTKKKLAQGDS